MRAFHNRTGAARRIFDVAAAIFTRAFGIRIGCHSTLRCNIIPGDSRTKKKREVDGRSGARRANGPVVNKEMPFSYAELEEFYEGLVARARRRGIACAITSGMACVAFGVSAATKD